MSRRRFLGLSGAIVLLYAGRQTLDIGSEMVRQEKAWLAADSDNDSFRHRHQHLFRNVTVGASFAPEQWSFAQGGDGEALRAWRWVIDDLGMRELRFGLRWQRVEASKGKIDLSQYHPFLNYAFERKLPVCLNLGPIRTFRWPEEHLPAWVLDEVQLPPDGELIEPGSPLAEAATDYLARLLDALASEFGTEALASLPIVQVENEPFYEMRTHHWVMDGGYVKDRIRQAKAFFPHSDILVGTAGRLNFGAVRNLILEMMSESDEYRGRFVMGFDYHYKTPLRDSFPIIRYTDPITFARVGYETCEANREAARNLGYRIEVTEAQAEPNGHLKEPGNSARHFRFVLLRCAQSVLDTDQPSLIRVWGIEELAKKALAGSMTEEHREMLALISDLHAESAVGG